MQGFKSLSLFLNKRKYSFKLDKITPCRGEEAGSNPVISENNRDKIWVVWELNPEPFG